MLEADVLRDSLDQELATYETLLSLGLRQQKALVARDIEAINDIAKRQMPLVAQAGRLESSGREALTRLAAHLGMAPEGATVTQVTARLESTDPEAAAALRSQRDRIAEAMDRLARTNWVNAQLLDSAMDAIRFTFHLFANGIAEPEVGYPAAEGPRRAAPVLLDQHA